MTILSKSLSKRRKMLSLLLINYCTLFVRAIVSQSSARMHLPVYIQDYTDFFSSLHHAHNCSTGFKSPNDYMSIWLVKFYIHIVLYSLLRFITIALFFIYYFFKKVAFFYSSMHLITYSVCGTRLYFPLTYAKNFKGTKVLLQTD